MTAFIYAETTNSNLICCICRVPFIEPTTTTTCSHTFCEECITQAVAITPQCPIDRSPLSKDDLRPANPIIRHLVDELIVHCSQRAFGCPHTCQRQLLATHLKEYCQFVKVNCCQDQCEESVFRKDVDGHSATCKYRMVTCEGCGAGIRFADLQLHYDQCPAEDAVCSHCESTYPRSEMSDHASICPNFMINCEHAMHGCPWTGPRHALSLHIRQCPYEVIKGFFALNASRLSALEAENNSLRGKVEELESTLCSTKRDVQAVKVALGPWFRPDGGQVPPRPSPPSEPAPRTYPRRPISTVQNNNAMFALPQDPGSPSDPAAIHPASHPLYTPPATDVFAQFFPPGDSNLPQTPHASEGLPVTTGQLVDGIHAHAPSNSPVAPLNLNSTLEGTLISLRNSIATLAASLDSEVRKHDIALTTESLRVNEEVMALRAIVHGLRMQVHQIMMDRNSQLTGRDDEDTIGFNYSHARAPYPEPWTSSIRYLNHNLPLHRPMGIGTTGYIQTTKL